MTDVKQLITEHLDIWLTAETEKKSGRGRSSGSNDTIYGVQKLRELILELAVSGKLIKNIVYKQDAKDLIEQIKIDQSKSNNKYKVPNLRNLPKGWGWALIDEIAESNIGLTYSPKDIVSNGVPVLRSSNIQNGKIDLEDLVRVNTLIKDSLWVQENDLLICARNGSKRLVGKTAKINGLNEPMSFGAFMAILRSPLNDYLEIFLNSPLFRRELDSVETTTINQITQKNLKNTVVPIPPMEIQSAIVEKVDELMQLCDQLEQQQTLSSEAHATLVDSLLKALTEASDADEFQDNWQRIVANFDVLFTTEYSIEQLKQTVLQLAVMGKLVKQDPSDEPASELLKKIADEKAKLIKEGKIKKSKPLPEISEDEKPFELPIGWEWEKLGNLTSKITDGDHQTPPRIETGELLLSAKNIRDGYLDFENCDHISKADYEKSRERCLPEQGDLLIVSVGGTIGRSSLISEKSNFALVRSVALIKPIGLVSEYLKLAMDSRLLQNSIHSNKRGGAQPCLYLSEIQKFLFPLAPKQEQQRIVEKVNQLFSMIEQLQVLQSKLQKTKLHLADALVANAVEGV